MKFIVITVLATQSLYGNTVIKPGQWEITTKVESSLMPPQSGSAQKCVTAAELTDSKGIHALIGQQQGCTVTNIKKTSADTHTYDYACSQGIVTKGKGTITYQDTKYHGSVSTTATIPGGQTMSFKTSFSGKYLGACKTK